MNFYRLTVCLFLSVTFATSLVASAQEFPRWSKAELTFTSDSLYDNPLYAVADFYLTLRSPTGLEQEVDGFWDGENQWKVRFKLEEIGNWTYETTCSDTTNVGLHAQQGSLTISENDDSLAIYQKGRLIHPAGTYHLTYSDGTPFFWTACTAWNGALRSTEEEWDTYLQHRVDNGYNTIQFVTTQWRGGPANDEGLTAYTKDGPITLNVDFFDRMDEKVDRINAYGLVAAPVILWGLPFGEGRHLSPGYDLPYDDAYLLARYIKARYGGNHVVWMLGGDAQYYGEMESRWKYLGGSVFQRKHNLVALHPHGRSWIGALYDDEAWLDIIGYQSSHSNQQRTVDWITKGPVAQEWDEIAPRPLINLEPNYEEIHFTITDRDVRNASYWSLFTAPVSGITYGANGLWPWLREGELIINHEKTPGISDWETSMKFPGSLQIGYLAEFMRQYAWWNLRPAPDLLMKQPGHEQYNKFISVAQSLDNELILVYLPAQQEAKLRVGTRAYEGRWFNPSTNNYVTAEITQQSGVLNATPPDDSDWVLALAAK